MRKFIFGLHMYVGLIAAVFLVPLSLSGAVIAFEGELNRAFHRDLTEVKPNGPTLNWDVFRARVEEQSPGWKLIRIYFPEQADRSAYVRLRSTVTHKARHVYVNPYTGDVLGSTEDGSNWIIRVHDLHVNLMAGKAGNEVATWSTFGLLLLSVSGIILWWRRRVFRVTSVSPAPRLNRELHLSVGFWSAPAMFLFAITGLGLHYQTGKLLTLLNRPAAAKTMAGHGTSIEGILATAHETLPGTTVPRLLLAEKAGDPIFVYQRFPEDKTPAGRSFTTLDAKTGAVLSSMSSRDMPLMQIALVQWTREIHTGTLLGMPTQIVASFFAVMLTVLALTGPMLWWNKRRAAARGRMALERSRREVLATD